MDIESLLHQSFQKLLVLLFVSYLLHCVIRLISRQFSTKSNEKPINSTVQPLLSSSCVSESETSSLKDNFDHLTVKNEFGKSSIKPANSYLNGDGKTDDSDTNEEVSRTSYDSERDEFSEIEALGEDILSKSYSNSVLNSPENMQKLSQYMKAPYFPFLTVTNQLQNSKPKYMFPNALREQKFESEFIEGKLLFLIRLKDSQGKDLDDYPYYEEVFKGKKRSLNMEFQLTFKKKPRGDIFLGGELTRNMKLGLVSKNLCKAIFTIINRIASFSHASLGDRLDLSRRAQTPTDLGEKEYAHIVFPLNRAVTNLVITKSGTGQEPPILGKLPKETPEQTKSRRAGLPPLDVGDTITGSLHSMYIDLLRWKAIRIGAIGEISLSTFWDRIPLSIVMYDIPPSKERNIFHIEIFL